ncbi:cyclic-di-AMP-binding protein CbpB [Lacticigenium naphthae]|uniref:cyclic-di-AMP-binding protein CbpB n=1 Tax=Lacticigenium naphthae TaxID=515351 RepID=UPI0003F73772|nr:cyclic-di-AMP-binding protein CbpB [Lacticigenium naphthae]
MIGLKIAEMLVENQDDLLVPVNQVAHVREDNKLDHALLVLTNVGFSVIPVLDNQSQLKGLISMPAIIRAVTGIKDIHFEKLNEIEVRDIMDTEIASLREPYELEDILHHVVSNAFVSIVNKEGIFQGIITRSGILKGTNRIAHEFEKKYEVLSREERVTEKQSHGTI